MDDYLQALQLRPGFAEARSNRGAALEALGNDDDALSEYLQAVETAPGFAPAHYNAARIYSRAGDPGRSLHHLEAAVSLAPQFRAEAEEDDNLAWVIKLGALKKTRDAPGSGPEA
jgi:tetratricopeptide (TPR) repeat protein